MDNNESKILELEQLVESLRSMFDEVLWDDQARAEYQKIDKEYKGHEK